MSVSVSIIVPCYNVAAYLDQCMESLAGQSMEEGQILLNNAESLDIQGGNISLKPLQAVVLGIMHKNNG